MYDDEETKFICELCKCLTPVEDESPDQFTCEECYNLEA